MNLDFIAYPLGKFLHFIYNTIAFNNYGLSIIFFTIIVKLVLLPLTLKQLKSTAKMQELQPIINDIQKKYKDDREKLNQELMKVYQENNYNPASGCLPLLLQLPILFSLYWVISQPLKFMLGKSAEAIKAIVAVARTGLGLTEQAMMAQQEIKALHYFSENRGALSQVSEWLKESELIDFNNFLGLHLAERATYRPQELFGPNAKVYIPLFILAILATVTTYISTKITMPKKDTNKGEQQNAQGSGMANSMMYIGPIMTLMFSFQLPAGMVLYWMVGYVFAIFQQLYINKFVLKKKEEPDQVVVEGKKSGGGKKLMEAAESGKTGGKGGNAGNISSAGGDSGGNSGGRQSNADPGDKRDNPGKNGGKKGGNKKRG